MIEAEPVKTPALFFVRNDDRITNRNVRRMTNIFYKYRLIRYEFS